MRNPSKVSLAHNKNLCNEFDEGGEGVDYKYAGKGLERNEKILITEIASNSGKIKPSSYVKFYLLASPFFFG